MTKERTFIAIKPDGVQRGYVSEIIGRFEKKGFKLVGLKQLIPSKDLAQNHYGVHRERPFFGDLVDFIAIKPDGVQRGYVAEIIGRFEKKGFKLVGLKQLIPSKDLAQNHYGVHRERPFFGDLVDFISSGPVVAMVWEGEGVILSARKLIGATKPLEAEPGTIRGDLAIDIGRNIIHGSDGEDTAKFEIDLWFNDEELCEWETSDSKWRSEN